MLDEDRFFVALSDEIRRRALVLLLHERELCVCELFRALELPQPTVSRHLAVLRDSDLVAVRRAGTWMFYRLAPTLPLWAYRIIENMAQCASAGTAFAADRARLGSGTRRAALAA